MDGAMIDVRWCEERSDSGADRCPGTAYFESVHPNATCEELGYDVRCNEYTFAKAEKDCP
ncbi:MAG: hypothetical protein HY698_08620 [Deltaproteobacteria bacterium]|nr:hypothetical protein [Deltaproteobacteria bacterium]